MDIYTIFMLTAVAVWLFMLVRRKKEFAHDKKKTYCIIMGFCLFLIAAFRSTHVGFDSGQYARLFNSLHNIDIMATLEINPQEPGFYILARLIALIGIGHQPLFAVIGGFFAFSISRFIYNYSKSAMVSFFMLIPMMYFAFSLTGLRQTVAISVVLFSIDYMLKRRFIPFILLIALASLFHNSAILFIPAYFLPYKKIGNGHIWAFVTAIPILYLLRRPIILFIQQFLYSEYRIAADGSESSGWVTLFVYLLILVTALLFKNSIDRDDKNFILFFSMMYVGMCIQMFVPLQPNIFRVSMYYNIVSILLIPGIIMAQKDKEKKILAYMLFFAMMAIEYYMFTFSSAGVNPYSFFWQ